MKPPKLTGKREAFAQALARGLTQSAAYREAYPGSEKWEATAVYVNASKLATNANIQLRVSTLRQPAVDAVGLTIESHLRDLLSLRDMASDRQQMSAAIAAEVARGKAAGLYIDRTELTGKGGGPVRTEATTAYDMSTHELLAVARASSH